MPYCEGREGGEEGSEGGEGKDRGKKKGMEEYPLQQVHDIPYLKQLSTICASKDEVESIQCGVEEGGECVQTLADDRLAREWVSHLLSRQCGAYQLTLSGTLHRAGQGCF